jgi:hypothetical protein
MHTGACGVGTVSRGRLVHHAQPTSCGRRSSLPPARGHCAGARERRSTRERAWLALARGCAAGRRTAGQSTPRTLRAPSQAAADAGLGASEDLQGRTVVVVGLALSGRAAAQLALARGAHVVGVDLNTTAVPLEVRGEALGQSRRACEVARGAGRSYTTSLFHPSISTRATPTAASALGVRASQTLTPRGNARARTTVVQAEPENAAAAAQRRVRTELGPHRRATFLAAHTLVLSPGVPPTQADVAAAAAAGVRVISELEFAYQALPPGLPIAAVTGTNGKSTVTTFTGQLLSACNLRTFVGAFPPAVLPPSSHSFVGPVSVLSTCRSPPPSAAE